MVFLLRNLLRLLEIGGTRLEMAAEFLLMKLESVALLSKLRTTDSYSSGSKEVEQQWHRSRTVMRVRGVAIKLYLKRFHEFKVGIRMFWVLSIGGW